MTAVEPRIAERRHRVSEDRARRRLRGIIIALLLIAAVLVSWWLLRSPVLAVREVAVTGAERADPTAIAASVGVVAGLPTISVDEGAVRSALLTDPWVAEAAVGVRWPGTVVIAIVERIPAAVVTDGVTSMQASADGMVLGPAVTGSAGAVVETSVAVPGAGISITDQAALGALAFVAELPADLRSGALVTVDGTELRAVVAGHQVRLGRPADMEQKARTLTALIATGLEPDTVIDLIAPLNPSIANPQPEVEGETEGTTEAEASD